MSSTTTTLPEENNQNQLHQPDSTTTLSPEEQQEQSTNEVPNEPASIEADTVLHKSKPSAMAMADPNADVPISSDDDEDDEELGLEGASPETKNRRRLTTEAFAAHGGIRLNWSHISYKVKVPDPENDNKLTKTKTILDNLSGNALPGRVLAIMGPSGGGKSSLTNTITGRLVRDLDNSVLDGVVCLNDIVMEDKHKPIVSFVCQDDIVMPKETPVDAFRFSASIRNEGLTPEEVEIKTEDMIRELKLTSCKDTIMGIPGIMKGLSGGEKRRANIGVELINNPPCILLDEPTSGLDSVAAYRIGKLMKALAHKEGRTVVCTIHSPSSELFALFDDLLLLAKGQVIYHGPANGLRDYFDCIGRPMPENINPVEFAMKLLQSKAPELQQYIDAWKRCAETVVPGVYARVHTGYVDSFEEDQQKKLQSEEMKNMPVSVSTSEVAGDEYSAGDDLPPVKNPMSPEFIERHGSAVARCLAPPPEEIKESNEIIDNMLAQRKLPSAWHELKLLSGRSWRNLIRDPMLTGVRTVQIILFAVFIGLVYLNLEMSTAGVQDRQGLLFNMMMQTTFMILMPGLLAFSSELPVFLQDQSSSLYGPISYYWSKTLVEIPINLFLPFLFYTIIYFMADLGGTTEQYFSYLAIFLANGLTSNALGMLLGAFAGRSPESALLLGPLALMPQVFVAGLFANTDRLEPGWVWLEWISFPRYMYKALIRIEFMDMGKICDASEDNCRYTSGYEVVKSLGFDLYGIDKWGWCLLMIFVIQFVFRGLGMGGLYYQSISQHAKLVFGDNYRRISKLLTASASGEMKNSQ